MPQDEHSDSWGVGQTFLSAIDIGRQECLHTFYFWRLVMIRSLRLALVLVGCALAAQLASAQDTKSAKLTREKLKQVIPEIDLKDIGAKAFFEEVFGDLDKALKFKIDNTTGISNNTKLTFKAKKITVEKLLNEVSDKYEFGWIVVSKENHKEDGWIIIRKSDKGKERGYEAGKEPKKTSLELPRSSEAAAVMWRRSPDSMLLRLDGRRNAD
jgi:hypothetical protein